MSDYHDISQNTESILLRFVAAIKNPNDKSGYVVMKQEDALKIIESLSVMASWVRNLEAKQATGDDSEWKEWGTG